jgi:hypothetical protein
MEIVRSGLMERAGAALGGGGAAVGWAGMMAGQG